MTESAFDILVEVLLSFILVIVVLGNLFVIEVVRRHARFQTIPNICITSLAIADLFVGLVNIPMYMYAVHLTASDEERYSKEYHMALASLDMYFGLASVLHLAFISMERCYAITFPLKRKFLQEATVMKILACLWLAAIIPVILFILKISSVQAIILVFYFLIPLIIIITSYIILAISAKLSWKKMQQYRVQQATKDLKLAKTLSIVVVVFIVTWTPFYIVLAISAYPKLFQLNLSRGEHIYFAHFVKFSQYAASACNPFIYAFRQREFKNAFLDLFQRTRHHGQLEMNTLVCESSSTAASKSTRTLFNRISKAFDKHEQHSLYRMNVHGEKTKANGQHCLTRL